MQAVIFTLDGTNGNGKVVLVSLIGLGALVLIAFGAGASVSVDFSTDLCIGLRVRDRFCNPNAAIASPASNLYIEAHSVIQRIANSFAIFSRVLDNNSVAEMDALNSHATVTLLLVEDIVLKT